MLGVVVESLLPPVWSASGLARELMAPRGREEGSRHHHLELACGRSSVVLRLSSGL
jgi:hypothetical protein